MATTGEEKAELKLKLLVDRFSERVIFAEAGKDFVDFLFGLLELPMGSILGLLVEPKMTESGSLCSVYQSVQKLDQSYLLSNQTRDSLLRPKLAQSNSDPIPLLKQLTASTSQSQDPFHPGIINGVIVQSGGTPRFSSTTVKEVEGYVKEAVTYMVMDDLTVKPISPLSPISAITLLNSLSVKDLGCVEEMIVNFDMPQALKLLKTSFASRTVLTDVFLGSRLDREGQRYVVIHS